MASIVTRQGQLTQKQMLEALAFYSKNELCAALARRILSHLTTVEKELSRNPGSFITAVLEGNYEMAVAKADSPNTLAFEAYKKFIGQS